jgi:hypothetical protein
MSLLVRIERIGGALDPGLASIWSGSCRVRLLSRGRIQARNRHSAITDVRVVARDASRNGSRAAYKMKAPAVHGRFTIEIEQENGRTKRRRRSACAAGAAGSAAEKPSPEARAPNCLLHSHPPVFEV